jgi:hypothetical protein
MKRRQEGKIGKTQSHQEKKSKKSDKTRQKDQVRDSYTEQMQDAIDIKTLNSPRVKYVKHQIE